jgi:hypothetical protein
MFRFSTIIGAFAAMALASSTVSAFAPAMGTFPKLGDWRVGMACNAATMQQRESSGSVSFHFEMIRTIRTI